MEEKLGVFQQTTNNSDGPRGNIKRNNETATMERELSTSIPLTKSDRNRLKYLLAERKRSLSLTDSNVLMMSVNDSTNTTPKRQKIQQSPLDRGIKSRFGFCGCPGRSIFDDEDEVVNDVDGGDRDSPSNNSSRKKERSIIHQFITQSMISENDAASSSNGSQSSTDFSIHCKRIPKITSSLSSNTCSSDESRQPELSKSEDDDETCSISTAPPSFHSILHDVASRISSRKKTAKVPSSISNASSATKRAVDKVRGRLAECITPSIDSPPVHCMKMTEGKGKRENHM